jgi:hypothetical protein
MYMSNSLGPDARSDTDRPTHRRVEHVFLIRRLVKTGTSIALKSSTL